MICFISLLMNPGTAFVAFGPNFESASSVAVQFSEGTSHESVTYRLPYPGSLQAPISLPLIRPPFISSHPHPHLIIHTIHTLLFSIHPSIFHSIPSGLCSHSSRSVAFASHPSLPVHSSCAIHLPVNQSIFLLSVLLA